MYACRNCEFMQPADNPCIYVNRLEQEIELVDMLIRFNEFALCFVAMYLVVFFIFTELLCA